MLNAPTIKSFVNNQGLFVPFKYAHSSNFMNNETLLSQSTMFARKELIDPVLIEARSVLPKMVGKVIGNDAKAHAAKQQAGKKHHQYSAAFKVEVINMMEQLGNTQESVVEHFRIDQSQVSRYLKNKIQIMKDEADDYRKKFF